MEESRLDPQVFKQPSARVRKPRCPDASRTRDYITILQWIWDDRGMSEHPAADPEHLGVIAERYAVEAVLGRGGMGKVYRVRDSRTGQRLALKRGWARDSRKAEKRRAL